MTQHNLQHATPFPGIPRNKSQFSLTLPHVWRDNLSSSNAQAVAVKRNRSAPAGLITRREGRGSAFKLTNGNMTVI